MLLMEITSYRSFIKHILTGKLIKIFNYFKYPQTSNLQHNVVSKDKIQRTTYNITVTGTPINLTFIPKVLTFCTLRILSKFVLQNKLN